MDQGASTPVNPSASNPKAGVGRVLRLTSSESLSDIIQHVKNHLSLSHVRLCLAHHLLPAAMNDEAMKHALSQHVSVVGVCAGSGISVLQAMSEKPDVFVTGTLTPPLLAPSHILTYDYQ